MQRFNEHSDTSAGKFSSVYYAVPTRSLPLALWFRVICALRLTRLTLDKIYCIVISPEIACIGLNTF